METSNKRLTSKLNQVNFAELLGTILSKIICQLENLAFTFIQHTMLVWNSFEALLNVKGHSVITMKILTNLINLRKKTFAHETFTRVWPHPFEANCYLLRIPIQFCVCCIGPGAPWSAILCPTTNKPTENYDASQYIIILRPRAHGVTLTYTGNKSFIWNRTSSEL